MPPNQDPYRNNQPGLDGITQPPSFNNSSSPSSQPTQFNPYAPAPAPPPKKRHLKDSWRSIFSTLLLLIMAPVIALSITAFAFQSYQVDGPSMETTLHDKDRLIVNKLPRTMSKLTNNSYIPHRGEIIIFNQNPSVTGGQSKQLIKRVVGLPGETVIVTNGKVIVINDSQPDGFDPDRNGTYQITAPQTPGEARFALENDEIFVLGDNRTNSEDSRYFGPIKLSQLVGELSLRIIPLNQVQKF